MWDPFQMAFPNGLFMADSYLEDHPRTCKWLGSPPCISHEVRPFGRGPTTLLRGRNRSPWLLTTYDTWHDPPSRDSSCLPLGGGNLGNPNYSATEIDQVTGFPGTRVDQLLVLGMGDLQPLIGNPYFMGPYKPLLLGWWVYPLLYGNNGSLDPSTYWRYILTMQDPG